MERLIPEAGDLNVEVLSPGILLVHDICSWADDIVEVSEEVDAWEPVAQGPDGHVNDYRNCHGMMLSKSFDSRFREIEDAMQSIAGVALESYVNYNKFVSARQDRGYQVLRYDVGEHYYEHVDSAFPLYLERQVSLSLTCSDPDAYEGGEFEFPLHGLKVRPAKGSALLFPSGISTPHLVHDVTKGQRYAVVSWFLHDVTISYEESTV